MEKQTKKQLLMKADFRAEVDNFKSRYCKDGCVINSEIVEELLNKMWKFL